MKTAPFGSAVPQPAGASCRHYNAGEKGCQAADPLLRLALRRAIPEGIRKEPEDRPLGDEFRAQAQIPRRKRPVFPRTYKAQKCRVKETTAENRANRRNRQIKNVAAAVRRRKSTRTCRRTGGSPSTGNPCRHAAARTVRPAREIHADMPPHRRFNPALKINVDVPPHGRFAQHGKSMQTCYDGGSVRQRNSMRTCRDGRQRALRRKTPACLRCPAPWRAYSAFLPDSQIWRISS